MTKFIDVTDDKYPQSLKEIRNPPKRLYYKGDINLLNSLCFSVVGSRNLTDYGRYVEKNFVNYLAYMNITIVSGLAIGADSVAHEECLNTGGKTIAVLGGGFNHIFPKENTKLYKRIIDEGGLIITEYEDNEKALTKNFPKRNRIISRFIFGSFDC